MQWSDRQSRERKLPPTSRPQAAPSRISHGHFPRGFVSRHAIRAWREGLLATARSLKGMRKNEECDADSIPVTSARCLILRYLSNLFEYSVTRAIQRAVVNEENYKLTRAATNLEL